MLQPIVTLWIRLLLVIKVFRLQWKTLLLFFGFCFPIIIKVFRWKLLFYWFFFSIIICIKVFRLLRKTLLLLCAFFFFIIIIIKVFRLSCGRPYHHCSRSLSSLILGFSVFNGRPYCYSLSIFGRFLVDFCPRDFSGMAERIILKILDLTSYHVESIPIEWF